MLEKKILFWYQQDTKLIYMHRGSSEISASLPFKILKMELVNLDLYQGSKCWVPRFPQALNIFHGNSTLHLEFPAGNPAKTAGNLSYGWGIKV